MNLNNERESKYLVVKANGGMGNRMLCAVTGILYGQLTGRITIVDWRDAAYSNDGSNTFSRFFSSKNVYPETVLPRSVTIKPHIWAKELYKSVSEMLHEHDPNKHSSIVIHRKYSIDVRKLDYNEDIIVFWYYTQRIRFLSSHLHELGHSFAMLKTEQIIRKMLTEEMILQDEIRQRIADFKSRYWPDVVIGLHIRYSDRQTDLSRYERPLLQFLQYSPKAYIFLATDNRHISEEYHNRFNNVFSTLKWFPHGMSSMHYNKSCPDRVVNGIEALVDMYLLASCDYLIYSGYSTFSWISRLLSDIPSERIVDIDRFNLKVRLKRLIREMVV
jgi:hypothetical protein